MRVLVAYASKTGFTKGIAEFIGEKLRDRGIEVNVQAVDAAKDLSSCDAFVIGSALYLGHWTKEARSFVFKNRSLLSTRPVWLFSSGPMGTSKTDTKGRDLLGVSGPKELDELQEATNPRDHRVFFGGLDGTRLTGATGFVYQMITRSKTAHESMPEGDFRDWKAIEAWADNIFEALPTVPA